MKFPRFIASAIMAALLASGTAPAADFPYELSYPMDYCISAGALSFMGGGAYARYRRKDAAARETLNHRKDDVSAFDRGAVDNSSQGTQKAGDIGAVALTAAPGLLLMDGAARENWATLAVMYAQGYMINAGLFMMTKRITDRRRPFLYSDSMSAEEKASRGGNRESFYSGHTAISFYSAVFLGTTYSHIAPASSWRHPLWALLLAGASFVGYSRYASGMHFPGDILAGAAAGSLVGYLVPKLHERGGAGKISVLPLVFPGGAGLMVGLSLNPLQTSPAFSRINKNSPQMNAD